LDHAENGDTAFQPNKNMTEDIQSRSWHSARLAPDWKALLDASVTEREVVEVTRDYLATWTPREIFSLPASCRPGMVKGGEDISMLAFELTKAHFTQGDDLELAQLILKMMTFFTHASSRVSFILSHRARDAAE
jgi:hypothetical protein